MKGHVGGGARSGDLKAPIAGYYSRSCLELIGRVRWVPYMSYHVSIT